MDFSDNQLKALIFDKLVRKKKWGHSYLPLDSVMRWIERRVKRNGRRLKRIVQGLVKEDYLLIWKNGNCISLNVKKKEKIIKIRRRLYK